MARDSVALQELLTDIKKWFQAETGQPFTPEALAPALKEREARMLSEFVHKRLGHLPLVDLINFNRLALEPKPRGKQK